jgi:hypothetical protein
MSRKLKHRRGRTAKGGTSHVATQSQHGVWVTDGMCKWSTSILSLVTGGLEILWPLPHYPLMGIPVLLIAAYATSAWFALFVYRRKFGDVRPMPT